LDESLSNYKKYKGWAQVGKSGKSPIFGSRLYGEIPHAQTAGKLGKATNAEQERLNRGHGAPATAFLRQPASHLDPPTRFPGMRLRRYGEIPQ